MFAFDFVGMFDYCRLCYPNIKKIKDMQVRRTYMHQYLLDYFPRRH